MTLHRSDRIISALNQLEQFSAGQFVEAGTAMNVLTGVVVRPLHDDLDDELGQISLSFPGGLPIEIGGDRYLDLQIIESCRFEVDGADGKGPVADRVASLSEHLQRKHDLG